METAAQREAAVREIVAAVTGADESCLDSAACIVSLGLDSLGIVAIVAQCSARFGVEFATDDVLELYDAETVGDLVLAISRNIERYRSRA